MIEGHGGNIYKAARRLACDPARIVDMSSNVSPLGMPPGLEDQLAKSRHEIESLPEADSITLRMRFSEKAGLEPGRVLAGNGTTEFIYAAPFALGMKGALIVGPTYSDYRDACDVCNVSCRFYLARREDGYQPDIEEIEGLLDGVDSVFICNPNNPTGRLIPKDRLLGLVCSHPDIRFIVDESYMPFVGGPVSETLMGADAENLVILHSFSKIFGIPGLRLGFLIGPPGLVSFFARIKQPWSVNRLAQAAGLYLLTQDDFVEKVAQFVKKEKDVFTDLVGGISGLRPFPAAANFILFELGCGIKAAGVFHKLAQEKILIRDCSNFYGLDDRYIRIALKGEKENRLCAERLRGCMESVK